MVDAHKNFSCSTVATAPVPADSGTTLVVASGGGALFPATPFNVTIWPAGVQPLADNAEIARVTDVTTDTLTIERAQEGSTARAVTAGDQIAATITTKTLTDIETAYFEGPGSAVDSNFVMFDTTTGKRGKDGGYSPSSFDAAGAAGAVASDLTDHEGLSASVHGFDALGNAPAQSHGNSRHSSTFVATSDTDYAYILQSVLNKLCSGLYEGGELSIHAGNTTVDIAAGTGDINNHTGTYTSISWGALNVSPVGDGTNYVSIHADGSADVHLTEQDLGVHVRLGHFYAQGGYVLECFSTPAYSRHFMGRVHDWMARAAGVLVQDGLSVSEQATALKLSISAGTFHARLGTFTTGTITTFTKMYNSADMGWGQDTTNANYVNVTQWNNITNNQATALVTMTASYWKKDVVMLTPSGNVYYMFGQAEYSTQDLAKVAPLPVIPAAIEEDGCYLASIVCQKNDANIGTRLADIRAYLPRIFGYGSGSSGVVVDHATLTNLGYSASGHTGFADSARGVTNGDSHDHSGGDGGQIAYSGLSGIPSTFAPSSHGNGAHTSTFITAADIFSGLAKISVGTSAPGSPGVGDLWVDTN